MLLSRTLQSAIPPTPNSLSTSPTANNLTIAAIMPGVVNEATSGGGKARKPSKNAHRRALKKDKRERSVSLCRVSKSKTPPSLTDRPLKRHPSPNPPPSPEPAPPNSSLPTEPTSVAAKLLLRSRMETTPPRTTTSSSKTLRCPKTTLSTHTSRTSSLATTTLRRTGPATRPKRPRSSTMTTTRLSPTKKRRRRSQKCPRRRERR